MLYQSVRAFRLEKGKRYAMEKMRQGKAEIVEREVNQRCWISRVNKNNPWQVWS